MARSGFHRCRSVSVLIAACAAAFAANACTGGGGSSPSSDPPPTPISVSFSVPASPTVSVQADIGAQNFTAAVTGDSKNKGVNFTLAGSGCTGSSCGTLSNATATTVTYIAPSTPPASAVILSAASVSDPSKSAVVTITVTPAVAVSISPTGMQSVQANIGRQNFTANLSNDSQNAGVTWMLTGSGCSGSTCGAISAASSSSGAPIMYSAPPVSPNPPNVTLTATSVTDKNQTAVTSITVSPAISVNVLPANSVLQINRPLQLTATISNDGQNAGVTWSLQGTGSLSNQTPTKATYTAPSTVPSSAVTVTATSISDPAQSSTTTIAVTPPIAVTIAPTPGFYYPVFANNSYPLQLNQSQSFTATVQYDPNNLGVNWAISGTDCSGSACGTLPPSNVTLTTALYTAPAALPSTQNPDVMTLTATSIADPTASASVTIPISQGIPGPSSPGWFEIPQTLLLPQCPMVNAIFGTDGCQGVIAAWGGGVADTTRNRLLFTGGGHENYAGNEVYALNLAPSPASSPITLARINDPVFSSPVPSCIEDWGPPATPSPRETYGNLAYMSDSDKMWLFGGAPFATVQEPCRSGGMWTLDFSANPPLWTQLNQALTITPVGSIDLGAGNSPAWINGATPTDINLSDYLPLKAGDPLSGLVYVYISNADMIASYNPATKTLTSLNSGQVVWRHQGQTQIRTNGVLDPVRHIFLIVGEGTMGFFDLNKTAPPFIDLSLQMASGDCGLNNAGLEDLNSPGLAYDSNPQVDRVIGWAGGNTIYVVDTTKTTDPVNPTMSCKALSYPGGPPQTPMVPAQTVPTGAQYNGTFGRFRYFPGLDIFAVVNDWQQNAFTFRMPPLSQLPPGY